MEQTFWIIYKSPSTCETLFFCRIQSKVCLWWWQTCRLNIFVEVEWTFQFENDPVVIWYTVKIIVKLISRFGIFDDLVNIFDLWLKSILDLILTNTSYLTDSYIVFTLKMESVSKITIFGLKMMVKSGIDFFFEIPPCGSHFHFTY